MSMYFLHAPYTDIPLGTTLWVTFTRKSKTAGAATRNVLVSSLQLILLKLRIKFPSNPQATYQGVLEVLMA